MENAKKQTRLMIIGFAILVIGLIGITYAFFNYTRTGSSNVIKVGRITFNSNQTNTITLLDVFPIDKTDVNSSNQVGTATINITGDTTYNDGIEYLLSVSGLTNTVNSKRIPIDVVVTANNVGTSDDDYFTNRGGDSSIYKVLKEETISNNQELLVGYITKGSTGINGTVTIKAYLDKDKIAITDTYDGNETDNMGTTTDWVNKRVTLTTEEWNSLQTNGISFQVKVEANEGIWVENPSLGYKIVKRSISNYTGPASDIVFTDTMDTTDTEDDVIYFSGTEEHIDNNYVWYSGKLWRIVAIYPDGTMKMITDNSITAMPWGESNDFGTTWLFQWLNEDFYDTLYNANNIVKTDSVWNYSSITSSIPPRPETISPQRTVSAPVGMINYYEYYRAYQNSSDQDNYLNRNFYWWLMSTYSTNYVYDVYQYGYVSSYRYYDTSTSGVRPSIVIKNTVEFTGEGTKTNPYKIVGDKENPTNNTTLLNSRSSGEYVTFDNDLYRIVDVEEGITKLTKVDFIKNGNNAITKHFASTAVYGKTTNTQTDDYWDYYLNNTWYNNISTTYRNMLVNGTYYLGYITTNFKTTICKDLSLSSVTTKTCNRYTSNDADMTFTGKVGLPRVGDMFSSQIMFDGMPDNLFWTLTRKYDDQLVTIDDSYHRIIPAVNGYSGVRPSITLKSTIKITNGTGMENDPFEISE